MERAKPIKVVPVRELQRCTRSVLDQLRHERRSALLTSNGAPIALIVPVSPNAEALQPGAGDEPLETKVEALPPEEAAVLQMIDAGMNNIEYLTRQGLERSQVTMALVRLEIKGLIRKRLGAYYRN